MVDEKQLRSAIAANIKRLRRQANLSQEALSERAGVARTALARIETSVALPSACTLFAIADALAVPADTLRQVS